MKDVYSDTPRDDAVPVPGHETDLSVSHTWFRGPHCNFNPTRADLGTLAAVENYYLRGWRPLEPAITRGTGVLAFGSCFAEHVKDWLLRKHYNLPSPAAGAPGPYIVHCGEGMVNSFVILQQLRWGWEGTAPSEKLWYGYDGREFGYDEAIREDTRRLLDSTDVFIITLGLSEIWYDEPTGGVFWRGVPRRHHDPRRHKFRVSTVAENKSNITAIYEAVRARRPHAKLIFTISPVPLVATFRDVACITANHASKAILRAALDEAMREIGDPEHLFYWPSYEIVMDLFPDRWIEDRRHIKADILEFVMELFGKVWCRDADANPERAWEVARVVGIPGGNEPTRA